jgi:tRNA(adenine34) deaminase
MNTHEQYMRRAIELGRRARETGDTPVGALVVRNGEVVAEGIEGVKARLDATAHAEIAAVRAACERLGTLDLGNCALYTTVEPCVMCAWALRLARIGIVICGARLPPGEGSSLAWHVLTSPDVLPSRPTPRVVRDVLSDECAREIRSG